MAIGMASLFAVAGVAVTSHIVQTVMEQFGHGDKVVFIKISGYCICAFIAWDVWWDLVHYVEMMFGVH